MYKMSFAHKLQLDQCCDLFSGMRGTETSIQEIIGKLYKVCSVILKYFRKCKKCGKKAVIYVAGELICTNCQK